MHIKTSDKTINGCGTNNMYREPLIYMGKESRLKAKNGSDNWK